MTDLGDLLDGLRAEGTEVSDPGAPVQWFDSYIRAGWPAEFLPRLPRKARDLAHFPGRRLRPDSLDQLDGGSSSKFTGKGPPPPRGSVVVDQPLQRRPTMTTQSEWWAEDTERWSKSVDWVTAETRADYLRHLRTIPSWLARLGFEPPSNAHSYTAEMVTKISWDRDRAGSSRQKALVVLKAFLAWKGVLLATNRRLWKEAMSVDSTPDPSHRHRLPVVDVVRLTRAARLLERWAIVVALALWNGLRQGEIRNLRVGDIDFVTRRVRVRYGKGNKARYLKLSSVAEGLLEPLRRLEDPYEPVYPFGRTTFARDLWRACDTAEIPRYAPHDLRATCVKMAKAAGANPLGRQLLLGHARAEQTRHYEGEDDMEIEDAVDKLSEFGERILEGE